MTEEVTLKQFQQECLECRKQVKELLGDEYEEIMESMEKPIRAVMEKHQCSPIAAVQFITQNTEGGIADETVKALVACVMGIYERGVNLSN